MTSLSTPARIGLPAALGAALAMCCLLGPSARPGLADEGAPAPDEKVDPEVALRRAEKLQRRAERLWDEGKQDEATALVPQILALGERGWGAESPKLGDVLLDWGNRYRRGGRASEAVPLLRRALAIREKAFGEAALEVSKVLHSLAFALSKDGAYPEAKEHFQRSLAIVEAKRGPDHPDVAATLLMLASVQQSLAEYDPARARMERALRIRVKSDGPDSPEVARVLNNLGSLLLDQGKPEEARPLLERAVVVWERSAGPDDIEVGRALGNLASALRYEGAYVAARAAAERALRIHEAASGRESLDAATGSAVLASILRDLGEQALARPLLERALAIRERILGLDHPEVARSLNNLAAVQQELGSHDAARSIMQRSLAIRERTLGPEHDSVAATLTNLASVDRSQGLHRSAVPLLRRAVAIWEKRLGPENPDMAWGLDNLAMALERSGAAEEAHVLLDRSLKIRRAKFGDSHRLVAWSLDNLAESARMRGDLDESERLLREALPIWEATIGPDHPDVASGLQNLALLLVARRSSAEAVRLMERSVALREAAFGAAHPDVAKGLAVLGSVCNASGDYPRAAEALGSALRLVETHLRNNLATLGETGRIEFLHDARWTLAQWLVTSPHVHRSGYEEVLRIKGLMTRVEAAERRLLLGGDVALGERLERLRATQRRISALTTTVPGARDVEARRRWQTQYADAAASADRMSQEIREQIAPHREALERLDVGVKEVQAGLAPEEALVDVLRSGDGYVAWIVRPGREVVRVDLGDAEEIDALAADPSPSSAGRLEERLFDPIEPFLGDEVKSLRVSPDAGLATVSFAALPRAVRLVSMAQDVVADATRPPAGHGALLVGGVEYGRIVSDGASRAPLLAARAPRGKTFDTLPGTALEIRALRARLGETADVLEGSGATEARVAESVVGRRILHFATHGFVRTDVPSALRPVKGDEQRWLGAAEERRLTGWDPTLLAGLALAGANGGDDSSGDDGILTAMEASYLDLRGVDLVVLSACETALGKPESGEGVLGLVRAFQTAGARDVIASLWEVDDTATRMLMERFYDLYLDTDHPLRPSEALRRASLWLRDWKDAQGNAPYSDRRFWAAFVCYERS